MLKGHKFILTFILILGFILRIWLLELLPYGFTPDEASFGYDAYSLINTGRDQWGHIFPLVLESFGDFKMPLYSYISIPFVYVLGLTKTAIRLPNALLGTAAIYITFLLVSELTKVSRQISKKASVQLENNASGLAILSSVMLATNPWHIMMSRGAFEANLTTFLMPFGAYLFIRGISEKKFLMFSSVVFGLNLFSYHSARLVTPLIFFALIVIYRKELFLDYERFSFKSLFETLKTPLFVFCVFLLAAFYTLSLGSAQRAKDITIFSGALDAAAEEKFIAVFQGLSNESARIFHNKYQIYAERFLSNYSQYLSVNFLFTNGPAEATYGMLPGRGVLFWFELPFLLAFLYSAYALKNKKLFAFILLWILLSPIPAALTTGRGFAGNRAVVMQPALSIASAMGAFVIALWLKKITNIKMTAMYLYGYFGIGIIFFAFFFESYFFVSPYKTAKEMLYGNLEVAKWLSENTDNKNIVVSKKLSEPHIYIAYASYWDPKGYQLSTKDWAVYKDLNLKFVDQLTEYRLGKYIFSEIDYGKYQNIPNLLLVGRPDEFPNDIAPSASFLYPDGTPSVFVVEPYKDAYAHKFN